MTTHPYITCRQLIDFIADYLDETLAMSQRSEFERHLGVCPSCVAYLDSYRRTVALGKSALRASDEPPGREVPPGVVAAVTRALAQQKPPA
ncbi:MAG: anti-sigma factor family protein [Phycisphaerales bacterium]